MASVTPCPACGLPSAASEIRCPRCFALKIKGGCTGACSTCRSACKSGSERVGNTSAAR